jgi:hypothetical protein
MSTTTSQRRSAIWIGAGDRRSLLRRTAVLGGYALLVWTIAIVLFFPNGWLPIWLAGGATFLLSFDRRLGPLGAALFVVLALPVGRGSEVGLPRVLGDVPIRAHDLIPLVGVVMALPAVVRRFRHPGVISWESAVPIIAFGAVGLLALAMGLVADHALRDVIRDTRWWSLYGIGLVALLAGMPRSAALRAIVWGLTIYCSIVLIGLLMPMFHGGLKYGAYAYDPRLRLHYGQATFLLVAIAFVTHRFMRRPSTPTFALLALLSAGVGVTLTRTLIAGAIGVAVLTALWGAVELARRRSAADGRVARVVARRVVPAVLAVGIGVGVGFGTYLVGVQIWTPAWAYSAEQGGSGPSGSPTQSRPVRPSFDRLFEDTANAGVAAQAGGRLASYGLAFADTSTSPIVGHGIGQLARVPWAWGGFRAHTIGGQPGVDNAFLTIGLKAGAIGIAAFAAMVLWPLRIVTARRHLRRMRAWYVPAWLSMLGLMLIQSFSVSGYAPIALSILVVLPVMGLTRGATPRQT